MTTTHDPITTLADHRPTESTWSPADRAATLANLHSAIATHPSASPTTARPASARRLRLAVVGVAAAAALVVGAPLIGDRVVPSASAVEHLASAARNADRVVIPAGKYLHLLTVENPDGPLPGSGPALQAEYPRALESWTDSQGQIWRRDSAPGGSVRYFHFSVPSQDSVNTPSPAFAATFPTQPGQLEAFLRSRVSGSSSQNEALFVAIGDMMRLGYVPPAVRGAALEVLADLPEVTATTTTLDGVDVTRVDFSDQSIRGDLTFSLYFDSATAALVKEVMADKGVTSFMSVVKSSDLVGGVPSTVIAAAAKQAADEEKFLRECNGDDPMPDCATRPKP